MPKINPRILPVPHAGLAAAESPLHLINAHGIAHRLHLPVNNKRGHINCNRSHPHRNQQCQAWDRGRTQAQDIESGREGKGSVGAEVELSCQFYQFPQPV